MICDVEWRINIAMTNPRKADSVRFKKQCKYRSLRAPILVLITCLLTAIPSIAQEYHKNIEFMGTLQSCIFNQHYDNPGFGAETQIRFWLKDNLGFAVASGISFFTIDQFIASSDGLVVTEITKEGTVLLFPVGGSILISLNPSNNLEVIFEGGVRYVFVKSGLEEVRTTTDSGSVTTDRIEYDIKNGVISLVSAYAVTELSSNLNLSIGLGYQFDISKGKEMIFEFQEEHELSSLLIRAGLITGF